MVGRGRKKEMEVTRRKESLRVVFWAAKRQQQERTKENSETTLPTPVPILYCLILRL